MLHRDIYVRSQHVIIFVIKLGNRDFDRLSVPLQPLKVSPHLGSVLITKIAVLLQCFINDVFKSRGQVRVQSDRRNWSPAQNGIEHSGASVAAERQYSGGHFVE